MSELYSVEVESVSGGKITLQVTTVHPDAGRPPRAPTFPLNLLVDLWSLLDRGYSSLIEGTPRIAEEDAKALAAREPWGPLFRTLCDLSHGVDVPVSPEEHAAIASQGGGEWRGQKIAGWGSSGDSFHVSLAGSEDGFAEAVAPLVAAYTQENPENDASYASWPESGDDDDRSAYDAKLPRVRLVLTLKDPALAGFVKAGMRFDTAAYY